MSKTENQPPLFPRSGRFLSLLWVALVVNLSLPAVAEENKPQPGGRVLIDATPQNFHQGLQKVTSKKDDSARGELPKNWKDDSGWAKLKVQYQLERGNAKSSDDDFLRATISDWESGQAQMRVELPKSGDELLYEITFEARSSTFNDFVIHLRQRKAPYRSYASKRVSLTPEWRQYSERWVTREKNQDLALLLDLGRKGIVDLRSLQLRRFSEKAYGKELADRAKDSEVPPNLLRQSRFPLGLPAGWVISRDLSIPEDVRVAPDAAMPAPDEVTKVAGTAAPLAIDTTPLPGPMPQGVPLPENQLLEIYSAPFAVPIEQPCTASIYVRGKISNGFLEIWADGRRIDRRGFSVDDDGAWKRVHTTFKPDITATHCVLVISGRGKFWIDGAMVNAGEEVQPYALQGSTEIHLDLDATANVVFGSAPVDLTVQVLNAPENAVIQARAYDLYGNEPGLAPLSVVSDRLIFSVPVYPDTPYGSTRVEAWVEDRSGQRVSPFAEVLFTRLREPHHMFEDAPESAFGAHFYPVNRQVYAAKAIGINWARLAGAGGDITTWPQVQPEKDTWIWRDDLIGRYRQRNVSLLGVWFQTPLWAIRNGPDNDSTRESREFLPQNLDDFTQYAARTARHFQSDIQHWQLWQNPSGFTLFEKFAGDAKNFRDRFIQPEDPAAVYAQMARQTRDRVLQEVPDAQIVGLNTGWGSAARDWTQRMASLNVPASADILGLNSFWGADRGEFIDPSGDFQFRFDADFLQPLRATYGNLPKPVWVTQATPMLDTRNFGLYRRTVNREDPPDTRTLVALADRIPRFIVNLLSQGVDKVFLDSMGTSRFLSDRPGQTSLTLVTDDLALNPGAAAHSAMAWLLEDHQFVMVQQMAPHVFVFFFEHTNGEDTGDASSVAVIIPTDLSEPYTLKTQGKSPAIDVFDLFGNPVKDGPRRERTVTYAKIPTPTHEAYLHLQQALIE